MITKGYYIESRNACIYHFSSGGDQIDCGNGSDNVVFYQKDHDFSKISKLIWYGAFDKASDLGADNTMTLSVGGVQKSQATMQNETEVNHFDVIDCSSITGKQTILIQGGGGSDNMLIRCNHLDIIEG